MFIRSRQDALDAIAQILDLPERKHQIVQSTIKVMLCLDAEQRAFMGDCQALLIEGGLESLRRARGESAAVADESLPIIVLDPESDRLFESLALGLDALKLTEVIRQVFPALAFERWHAARALLAEEPEIQTILTRAIKARADQAAFAEAERALEARLRAHRPIWAERAPALRAACFEVLRDLETADRIFECFALADERAMHLLAAIDSDPGEALHQIEHLRELADSVRSTRPGFAQAA